MSAIIHHFQENRENLRENHKGNYRGSGRPARYRQGNTGGTPVPPIPSAQSTPSVCTYSFALEAFSLIEILVAMAVLAMLMTFMFAMVGGTSRLWERGNAKVEAAQAARVGLNRLADDLQNAMAAQMQSVEPTRTSVSPIFASNDVISGIRLTGDPLNPYNAFKYSSEYSTNSANSMRAKRYYLVNRQIKSSNGGNFFNDTATPINFSGNGRTFPLIDNCVRLGLEYYDAHTGNWTTNWTSQTNLPDGVMATVIVIDSRTAERLAQINGGSQFSASDINIITNTTNTPSGNIQPLLRSGSVVMRRFIPFNNHQH